MCPAGPGCAVGGGPPASRPCCVLLLVAPLVFWAPSGPAAVCAGGRRPARSPSALRASLGASSRSPARPCHRPPAPRQIPPAPSTPVGPGRWSVAGCVVSMPGRDLQPPITFARNSPAACSNIEFASLELQCFWGVSKMSTINYVRNLGGGGVVAARGHRGLALSARPPAYLKPLSPLRVSAAPQLKPPSPLRVSAAPQLKPPSPLRGRNGCFGAFFGRRGVVGFSVPLLGVSSGVGGFNVAALSRLVREKVRPAWPDGGREREKVRPAHEKWPKIGVFTLAGRTFSRKGRRRGGVGRVLSRTGSRGIPRGELCCAVALVVSPSTGSVNPSIRSYTHLVEAGRGRPTRPQQPTL